MPSTAWDRSDAAGCNELTQEKTRNAIRHAGSKYIYELTLMLGAGTGIERNRVRGVVIVFGAR